MPAVATDTASFERCDMMSEAPIMAAHTVDLMWLLQRAFAIACKCVF